MPPGVRQSLPNASNGGIRTGDEDGSAAAEDIVEGYGQPASDESAAQVRRGVDQADEPGRRLVIAIDAELGSVEDLGAVDDSFVLFDGRLARTCRGVPL